MRKLFVFLLLCIMLIAVGIVFKTPILRSFSHFLIRQDAAEKADIIVVLSGNGFDRGREAARLYREGYAPHIVCPGGNPEIQFYVLGDTMYESDLCSKSLIKSGAPDSAITVIHYGTSTREEADTILGYCRSHHLTRVMVVTSLFHTRRAASVYRERFAQSGIKVIVRGAHDSSFDEELWWQDEYGLIALNNEYMKTLYYLVKRNHHGK